MITVIGYGVILLLVSGVMVDTALKSLRQAAHSQGFQAAIGAADAGVNDYLYRLNSDPNYVNYTTTASSCSGIPGSINPDPNNAGMRSFVALAGAATQSSYTYRVDTSSFCTAGVIKVTSTGKVKDVTRTEVATIKRRGFLDFLYFTDLETTDPALYGSNPFAGARGYSAPNNTPAAVCGRHYYDPTSTSPPLAAPRPDDVDGKDPGCRAINFLTGDVLNGPLHTNDAMLICGTPTFKGKTTTSWRGKQPDSPRTNTHYRVNSGCSGSSPSFQGNNGNACRGSGPANDACYAPQLTMPPSNQALKSETNPALASPAGCLFSGPTKIVLNSNGTMDVTSPDTPRTGANTGCALGATQTAPTNLAIPSNGVVFVQNAPAGASSNVACTTPRNNVSPQNPVGYPQANDVTTYGCTDGDVFISGTLAGALTVAAENDVIVTDNLAYKNGTSGADVLGLVAQGYVELYHPVNSSGTNLVPTGRTTVWTNPTINAAVLSITHSFRVQNPGNGAALGTLTLNGAIAQKYRGIVTSDGSGYLKNYSYDARLQYRSPPKFIDPVRASYQVAQYSEK